MSAYSCKVVVVSYVEFSFLKWEAEFHLHGDTDNVPKAYVPKFYPSEESFLADQAIKFGIWLLEGTNGLLHNDGEVTVYDPNDNILWKKQAFRHATPAPSQAFP